MWIILLPRAADRRRSATGDSHLAEMSQKLAALSDTDLVSTFREALLAVYPVMLRLDCLEDDSQPYDDFEEVAECLWRVIVCSSIGWREGFERRIQLSRHGWDEVGPDGFIGVSGGGLPHSARFVGLIGDRRFGPEPFNAVQCILEPGNVLSIAWSPSLHFRWVRSIAERADAMDSR